jgi:hypothetical protein
MKGVALIVLSMLVFVLQLSFIPALRPLGVVPDLGLALVALVGLYGSASMALLLAVCGGLALDLVSGGDFGLYVGLFTVVALTAGFVHRAGFGLGETVMSLALVLAGTLLQDLVVLGGLVRVAVSWPIRQLLLDLSYEMVLNALFVLLLRPLVAWLIPPTSTDFEVGR